MDYHVLWHLLLIVVCLATASDHDAGPRDEELVRNPRVAGGWDAKESYPFVVSIRDKNKKIISAGSIVPSTWTVDGPNTKDSDVVLTAAQFVCQGPGQSQPAAIVKEWRVVQGGEQETNSYSGGIVNKIKKVICHKNFNKTGTLDYDVAILKLEKPFIFAQGPQAIDLLWDRDPLNTAIHRTKCTIVGWGLKMIFNGSVQYEGVKKMQENQIMVAERRECETVFHAKEYEFCYTGGGFATPCLGDVGAPIFCDFISSGRKLVAFHSKQRFQSINVHIPPPQNTNKKTREMNPDIPCFPNRLTIGSRLAFLWYWVDEQINPWDPSMGPENRRRLRVSKERAGQKGQADKQKSPKPGGKPWGSKSSAKPKKG